MNFTDTDILDYLQEHISCGKQLYFNYKDDILEIIPELTEIKE